MKATEVQTQLIGTSENNPRKALAPSEFGIEGEFYKVTEDGQLEDSPFDFENFVFDVDIKNTTIVLKEKKPEGGDANNSELDEFDEPAKKRVAIEGQMQTVEK